MFVLMKIYLAIGIMHSAYCFLTADNQRYAEARDGLREQVQKVNPQLRPIAVLLITTIVLFIVSMTVIFWPIGMRWRSKRI